MIDRFFGPISGNEDELRARLLEDVHDLLELFPHRFQIGVLDNIDSSAAPKDLIAAIRHSLLPNVDFDESAIAIDPKVAFRETIHLINSICWQFEIEIRLCALLASIRAPWFSGIRLMLALSVKDPDFAKSPGPEVENSLRILLTPNQSTTSDTRRATEVANRTIDAILSNSDRRDAYSKKLVSFEDAMIATCEQALPTMVMEMLDRLGVEAIVGNFPLISEIEIDESVFNPKGLWKAVEKIAGAGKKTTKRRLGIKGPGGNRPKPNAWTNDDKVAFSNEVLVLKPIWIKARTELIEKNFDRLTIDKYRSETNLQTVPARLWIAAVNTWKAEAENFHNEKDRRPTMEFVYKHAISLLELPPRKSSTCQKYASVGRGLSRMDSTN